MWPPTLPVFNITANIWRDGTGPPDDPAVVTIAQLYFHSRADLPLKADDFDEWIPPMYLRVPMGTDLRPTDLVEAAAGDAWFYRVRWTDRVHRGFPNEYFVGLLVQDADTTPPDPDDDDEEEGGDGVLDYQRGEMDIGIESEEFTFSAFASSLLSGHYVAFIVLPTHAVAPSGVTVGGTALTFGTSVVDIMLDHSIYMWHGEVAAGGAVVISVNAPGVTILQLHGCFLPAGMTYESGDGDDGMGGGTSPTITTNTLTDADSIVLAFTSSRSAGMGGLGYDTPFNTHQGAELDGFANSLFSYLIVSATTPVTAEMLGFTPTDWEEMVVVFH